jgi:hypothetical protein
MCVDIRRLGLKETYSTLSAAPSSKCRNTPGFFDHPSANTDAWSKTLRNHDTHAVRSAASERRVNTHLSVRRDRLRCRGPTSFLGGFRP